MLAYRTSGHQAGTADHFTNAPHAGRSLTWLCVMHATGLDAESGRGKRSARAGLRFCLHGRLQTFTGRRQNADVQPCNMSGTVTV